MNLCLGIAQFGMDYGISNQGRPLLSEVIAMLDYASRNGVDTIDTASAYGEAETLIGHWFRQDPVAREKIKVISKLMPNVLDDLPEEQYYGKMKEHLEQSLANMNMDYLDGYLLHSAKYVFNDAIIEALAQLKKEGYALSVGVSVYEPPEAQLGINSCKIDILQLPYSIFDQRMLHSKVFELAKEKGTEIHARSAFLQGLLLMEEHEVPPFLAKAKPLIRQIDDFCKQNNLSRVQLAFAFVKQTNEISHLVFGVNSMEQLRNNIGLFYQDIDGGMIKELAEEFTNLDEDIIMPSRWPNK